MLQRWPTPESKSLPGTTDIGGLIGKAAADLGTRIAGGQWAPGATIPREAELCVQLGVSRSIMREACRVLASKGMIRSRTSDGTRVLPTSHWRLLDADVLQWRLDAGHTSPLLRDLLVARLAFEPGIARLATAAADKEAHNQIERAWHQKQVLFEPRQPAESPTEQVSADFNLHRAFCEASGSPLLAQLVPAIAASIELMHAQDGLAHDPETSCELYTELMGRFRAGDADGADAAMRAVIEWLVHLSETPATSAA